MPTGFTLLSVASLMAVTLFRQEISGCAALDSRCRAGQHFQPSEWVKLILILMLAKYFAAMCTSENLAVRTS